MYEKLGKFILGIVALIVAVLGNGYVTMTIWGWFIAPTFGLSVLSFSEAIGFSLFISYCTYHPSFIKDEFKDDFSQQLITAVCRPIVALAFAYMYLKIFF